MSDDRRSDEPLTAGRMGPGTLVLAALGLVALLLAIHFPLLATIARIGGGTDLDYASDVYTHYLRVLMARDYFLPSGHRWGWDPFWFQGYVPFLLYPHLLYVTLAGLSGVFGADPARLVNATVAVSLFALPLAVALPLLRTRGVVAGFLALAWVACLDTTFGGGARGLLHEGMLTQQVGLVVFALFAYQLAVARRFDRAAVWLGLLASIHMHAAVVGTIVWVVAGVGLAMSHADRRGPARWLEGSLAALVIACPAWLGLWLGWEQIGRNTFFAHPELPGALFAGILIGPWPVALAILLAALAAFLWLDAGERRTHVITLVAGALLIVLSLQQWQTGAEMLDRVLFYILRLRTLPFAVVWLALVAAAALTRSPLWARGALGLVTVAAIAIGWSQERELAHALDTTDQAAGVSAAVMESQYTEALDWIAADSAGRTAGTLLVRKPKPPVRQPLQRLTHHTGLPTLGGHGLELSPVQNFAISYSPERFRCEALKQRLQLYGIGYVIGFDTGRRRQFLQCLDARPAFQRGSWWVFRTPWRWDNYLPIVAGFRRNDTWTELEWEVPKDSRTTYLRLPMANTAPWRAAVDGNPAAITSTGDRMMYVEIPPNAEKLRLTYAGYRGEWASVLVGLVALGLALVRAR